MLLSQGSEAGAQVLWEPTFCYSPHYSQPGRDKEPKAWLPHCPEHLAQRKCNVSSTNTQDAWCSEPGK